MRVLLPRSAIPSADMWCNNLTTNAAPCAPATFHLENVLNCQLNEEQLHLQKSVREFAQREIAPNVMKWDEASEFPFSTIKELAKLGLLGMIFPLEYGGAGMGYVEYVTAIDELSRVDGSVGIIVRGPYVAGFESHFHCGQ